MVVLGIQFRVWSCFESLITLQFVRIAEADVLAYEDFCIVDTMPN